MAAVKQNKKSHLEKQTVDSCDLDTVHIQIGESGEISVWGLDQNSEEVILERTGNQNLAARQRKMSYTLCG